MPAGVPRIRLPRGWPRFAKRALLYAVALARVALVELHAGFETSAAQRIKLVAENERLRARVALLEELMRLKDARMELITASKRPHYAPAARLQILTLRAAQGWSVAQTARAFLLTPKTVASWMWRLDEEGPEALVSLREPVNRFPDFVALVVQRLRTTLPSMGKVRIAQVLARAGLVLSASTVKRLAERRVASPEAPRPRAGAESAKLDRRPVTAKRPNHVWHVDLTVVPAGFGFWLPWLPFSLPVFWPFCFWVAAVVDHYSRAVVVAKSFLKEPSAGETCALLDAAVKRTGRAPPHIVSDRGVQFGKEYRASCTRHGVKARFGALGQHGSIAIIERFWRSMKQECFRRLTLVPFAHAAFAAELEAYVRWYNEFRPHRALGGRTPAEVRDGLVSALERPTLEPRARFPLGARAGPRRLRRQVPVGGFIVDFFAPALRLVIEVDGSAHEHRRRADARRDEKLRRLGYHVLRIDVRLVMRELPRVVELLQARVRGHHH